jgi:branched-chain amino acid transport system permease protein
LVWLAVVVTMGVRSITAAVLSGLAFSLLPGVFQTYVPTHWAEVPAVLFGLGALGVARHPEGVVLYNGRQISQLLSRMFAPEREPHRVPAGQEEAWLGGPDSAVVAAAVGTSASGPKTKAAT